MDALHPMGYSSCSICSCLPPSLYFRQTDHFGFITFTSGQFSSWYSSSPHQLIHVVISNHNASSCGSSVLMSGFLCAVRSILCKDPVPVVKHDPLHAKVQWTCGVLTHFRVFFWLRVFLSPSRVHARPSASNAASFALTSTEIDPIYRLTDNPNALIPSAFPAMQSPQGYADTTPKQGHLNNANRYMPL